MACLRFKRGTADAIEGNYFTSICQANFQKLLIGDELFCINLQSGGLVINSFCCFASTLIILGFKLTPVWPEPIYIRNWFKD